MVALFIRWTLCFKLTNSKKYPPKCQVGIVESVKAIAGPEMPWFLIKCAKSLGYIFQLRLPLPGVPMVVCVGDADVAQDILRDSLTEKPMQVYSAFDSVTRGRSIITAKGSFWTHSRKNISRAFTTKHTNRMNQEALSKTKSWIEHKLQPMIDLGESFDIGKEMIELTLSIVIKAACDYEMNNQEASAYIHELELAIDDSLKTAVNPLRRFLTPFLQDRRAYKASKKVQDVAFKIMDNYRSKSSLTEGTIIDLIMKNDLYKTDEERASIITGLIIGGYDTTGYALAWTLIELAQNPSIVECLRKDLSVLPQDKWKTSTVLKSVVKEGMRLHPPSLPGSVRVTGKDFSVENGGFMIPKGSIVFVPFVMLFHNPANFKKPDEFIPSRWINPSSTSTKAFIPFSLGTRNCPGQALANAELHSVIAYLCAHYDFTVKDKGSFDGLKPSGVRLVAQQRKGGVSMRTQSLRESRVVSCAA